MKIIIDRDSVCMGDDFGHQLTIECSDDETLESLMNKILQTDFFPAKDLSKVTKKWKVKIDKQNILTFFPNENKVDYHINKNTIINNLKSQNIYFKEFSNNRIDIIELFIFPFLFVFLILRSIYTEIINTIFKLKQQKWTHFVAPFYFLIYLFLLFTICYDIKYPSEDKFSMGFGFILFSLYILPRLAIFSFTLIILLKLLSLRWKNIDIIKNKFLLDNKIYNVYWLLNTILMLYSFCILIVFTFSSLFE